MNGDQLAERLRDLIRIKAKEAEAHRKETNSREAAAYLNGREDAFRYLEQVIDIYQGNSQKGKGR